MILIVISLGVIKKLTDKLLNMLSRNPSLQEYQKKK